VSVLVVINNEVDVCVLEKYAVGRLIVKLHSLRGYRLLKQNVSPNICKFN
jgi:hypothetical protein